jgi:hypothetical protein
VDAPYDPVFNNPAVRTSPLLTGPRFPDDPLQEMQRVQNIEALYAKPPLFLATPWLLNPSSMKILYASTVKQLWRGLGHDGVANLGMAIVGFSLPAHDDYARQVLYGIVKNYQSLYWEDGFLNRRKTPLRLVEARRGPVARHILYRVMKMIAAHPTQTFLPARFLSDFFMGGALGYSIGRFTELGQLP